MMILNRFQIWSENNVLLACVTGSWDHYVAEDYCKAFKAVAAEFKGQRWAHIVYLDDWQLGTPDIEPIIQNLVTWCLHNGLVLTAQVYCPHSVKRYQLDKMIIDKTLTFERRMYSEEQSAFNWLAEKGFMVENTSLKRCS
ncbi:hypothetical protein [Alishewanella tabrizica]|uniref:STAS/SEC14 domain-containing protein n=1 Tax=Alishewanella tabrizica TaxID=671278 RepID=A0ABQ2WF10_9ALTE|nr:hypothetical protein [Alishewanella tabrizica]GGW49382.1 hypothetical protein GCM10008111_01400 [Alishewanella tabrizica]